MARILVTRHRGTIDWIEEQGEPVDRVLGDLDDAALAALAPGDVVIGVLPLHRIWAVQQRGARFVAVELELPPAERGRELTARDMARLGARLVGYRVERID
jgi:CRISPR-associated protein Csx16